MAFAARSGLLGCLIATLIIVVAGQACAPAKKGWSLMANTNWQVVDEDKVTAADQLGSSRAAERACMADRNCLAWNNWYYYISASSSDAVTYYKYDKMCTYARSIDGCAPAKTGFDLMANLNWEVKDKRKVRGGQTNPADAERLCTSNSACIAWNSYGYYIFGDPAGLDYYDYPGLCLYIKQQ